MNPRISVVIPAYNAEATLAKAIDSVLGQTWPPVEVLVVDDGSKDGTASVVKGFGDSHIPVRCIRQDNAGPSAARNRGVREAQGDWIAFLDADDWYYPTRLERHAALIQADPGLDFLVGNFEYRDPGGALLRQSMASSELGRELFARHGPDGNAVIDGEAIGRFIVEQFSDTRMLTVPRATILQLGGFPIDLRICEDVVFLLRLCARSHKAAVTCDPGAVYLVHDSGLIRSDPLRAQTESVRALRLQAEHMASAPAPVAAAWQQMVKGAYLDLAYHLAKTGHRGRALAEVGRSLAFQPRLSDLRHLVSVLLP